RHSQRDKKLGERRKYRTDFPDPELSLERQIERFVVTLQLVFLSTEASNNAVITEQLLGHLQHLARCAFALARHLAHLLAGDRNQKAQYRHHYQEYQRQLPVQIKNVRQQKRDRDRFTDQNLQRIGDRILQSIDPAVKPMQQLPLTDTVVILSRQHRHLSKNFALDLGDQAGA